MPGGSTRVQPMSRVLVLSVVAALVVLAGAAQKMPCIDRGWVTQDQNFRQACYSDVARLYPERGLHTGLSWWRLSDSEAAGIVPMEYPVLTVVLARAEAALVLAALGPDDPAARAGVPVEVLQQQEAVQDETTAFFLLNLAVMALLAGAIVFMVGRRWGVRPAAVVALSPHLFLSGGVNWDLLAVAAMVASVAAWDARQHVVAGVAMAGGVAAKLFPALTAGTFVLLEVRERGFTGALRSRRLWVTGVVAAGVWLALNVPAALTAPVSWSAFYRFSQSRPADIGSLGHYGTLLDRPLSLSAANLLSEVVLVVLVAAVAVVVLRARQAPTAAAVTLLLLVAFVLSGKVYSPQYTLWLLPFVAVCVRPLALVVVWQVAELLYWGTHLWAWVPEDWYTVVNLTVLTLRIAATLLVAAYVVRSLRSPTPVAVPAS